MTQAIITMLMAFDVVETSELTQAVTAVSLVLYVAVNELWCKPHRERNKTDDEALTSTSDES